MEVCVWGRVGWQVRLFKEAQNARTAATMGDVVGSEQNFYTKAQGTCQKIEHRNLQILTPCLCVC